MMIEKRFVPIGVEWTDGFIQDHISDRDLFNIGAVCNLLNDLSEENEELYEENKRLREILEYGKIDCKHLISYEEGDYCMKVRKWFFDFEGYEDECPTCKYCKRK